MMIIIVAPGLPAGGFDADAARESRARACVYAYVH